MQSAAQNFDRKKPDQLVYVELGRDNGGMMLAASQEGFQFRAVAAVRANGPIPFSFSLDGVHRLEGIGELAWTGEDRKSGGIRFTEVSQEFRQYIDSWLVQESGRRSVGREVVPVVEAPVDTLEKIRKGIRTGFSAAERVVEDAPSVVQEEIVQARAAVSEPQPLASSAPSTSPVVPELQASALPKMKFGIQPESAGTETAEVETASSADEEGTYQDEELLQQEVLLEIDEEHEARITADLKAAAEAMKPPVIQHPPEESEVPAITPTPVQAEIAENWIPPLEETPPAIHDSVAPEMFSAPEQASPQKLNRVFAGGIITIAILVILGALAVNFRHEIGSLLIQAGQSISGEEKKSEPGASSSANQPQNSAQPPQQKSDSSPAKPLEDSSSPSTKQAVSQPTEPPSNSQQPASQAPSPENKQPSATTLPATSNDSSAEPTAEAGTGQREFEQARIILKGENRQRDLSEAVDLLWSGVRKGYVPAEVTLADLFLRGDGVAKNCEQARILLEAATKKGSPAARDRLTLLLRQGCS